MKQMYLCFEYAALHLLRWDTYVLVQLHNEMPYTQIFVFPISSFTFAWDRCLKHTKGIWMSNPSSNNNLSATTVSIVPANTSKL